MRRLVEVVAMLYEYLFNFNILMCRSLTGFKHMLHYLVPIEHLFYRC